MNLPPHLMNLQATINNLLVGKTQKADEIKTITQSTNESKPLEHKLQSKHKEKKKLKKSKIEIENKSKKIKNPRFQKRRWKVLRKSAGEAWEDPTLEEWPENDYRIFCGDIGNEVGDDILANAFRKYSSFIKARVIRDKHTGKSRGYGFLSFSDPNDYIKVMREMNGKYVGNRPIRLKRSTWKDRCLFDSKSKVENVKFKKNRSKFRARNFVNSHADPHNPNIRAVDNMNYSSINTNMMGMDMMNQYNQQMNNINMMQYNIQPNPGRNPMSNPVFMPHNQNFNFKNYR
jgi:RNA recognition motif-containing protein